jgi:predicted GNAT family N-acyltransferase
MAVSKSLRGRGIGSLVLGTLLDEAQRQGHTRLVLHAQVTAKAFYTRHGFIVEGDDFMEAGMAHVRMVHQTA